MDLAMPPLLVLVARREGRDDWLVTVPETVRVLEERWSLEVGEPYQPGGQTAWVAPALGKAGEQLVLKVGWAHPEAAHEGAGLREWDGNGAVRLFASEEFDETSALLLERCIPGVSLTSTPGHEQDVVIAGLLRRLWRAPMSTTTFRASR